MSLASRGKIKRSRWNIEAISKTWDRTRHYRAASIQQEETMLKRTLLSTAVLVSFLAACPSAFAGDYDPEARAWAGHNRVSGADFGTQEEAGAMLNRAVAAVKKDKAAAIESFNHNDEPFRDRDLFVFCFNGGNGKFTAHEAFVTRDVRELRDASGAAFGEEMYSEAQEGRITEVAFISPVPGSTELAIKSAYVTRVGDQVCGVSAYQTDGPEKSIKSAQSQRW
jgi:hypothetical protein